MLNIRKWVESIQTMYDFQKSPGVLFILEMQFYDVVRFPEFHNEMAMAVVLSV